MNAPPKRAGTRAPVLKTTLHRLRELSLAAQPGDFLGTEGELRELLGVSRPTYRQAVRLLEQDQLLTQRMGPHGGCYASRPNPGSLARLASLYLQVERATLKDLITVSHGLQQHALTAACACTDENLRATLRRFMADAGGENRVEDASWFLEQERAFERIVLALAANPALSLFFDIARKFVDESPASQILIASIAMRRLRVQAWARMGAAILAGDAAGVIEISRQQHSAFLALIPGEALQGNVVRAA